MRCTKLPEKNHRQRLAKERVAAKVRRLYLNLPEPAHQQVEARAAELD